MKAKRIRNEQECTARGALEVLKGVQTIEEVAKDFDIYPMQVTDWKKAWPQVPGASSAPVGRRSKPRISQAYQAIWIGRRR